MVRTMKVRDVIYVVAMVQAKKALSDVQLITKEKMELTEEYIQTFFDELVVGAAIEAYDEKISVIKNKNEHYDYLNLLDVEVNNGWWVYFADNIHPKGSVHCFRWYPSRKIAGNMSGIINTMKVFNTLMVFEVR